MEPFQIETLNDTFNLDLELSTFEIHMPSHMHQMYLERNELESINLWIDEFIDIANRNGYTCHKWYDYHLRKNTYEFNKD